MADQNISREKRSAAGIRLRRSENAVAALSLAEDSAGERPGNAAYFVLTDQRMFHISGPGATAQIKSTPLQDVGEALLARRHRYFGFLLAAGFFLVTGVSYLLFTAVAGAFQGIVLVPTLIFGGGFLAIWWYSGGGTVLRVEMGDTQLECVTSKEQQREALAFLEQLNNVKGKRA